MLDARVLTPTIPAPLAMVNPGPLGPAAVVMRDNGPDPADVAGVRAAYQERAAARRRGF